MTAESFWTMPLDGWLSLAGILVIFGVLLRLVWVGVVRPVFFPRRTPKAAPSSAKYVSWSWWFKDMPDWPQAAEKRDALLREWSQKR